MYFGYTIYIIVYLSLTARHQVFNCYFIPENMFPIQDTRASILVTLGSVRILQTNPRINTHVVAEFSNKTFFSFCHVDDFIGVCYCVSSHSAHVGPCSRNIHVNLHILQRKFSINMKMETLSIIQVLVL